MACSFEILRINLKYLLPELSFLEAFKVTVILSIEYLIP
jgi:hypothetical protein